VLVLARVLCATYLVSLQDMKVFFREKGSMEEVLYDLGKDDSEDHGEREDILKWKLHLKTLCIVTILGLISFT
jgi:hypothetical protein